MKQAKQAQSRGRKMGNDRPDPTWTVARLCEHFGVSAERLLLHPRPGMATEEDLLYVNQHGNRRCELIEGVLVEKAMGFREAFLAGVLLRLLADFVDRHQL